MIFSISMLDKAPDKASKISKSSFVELNIWERQHIEEWIRSNPEMVGEELLIVSTEFDGFSNSKDRLDVLAVDRQGNLVVIELKRDSAAGYADLQALRYAAMVSSMTIDDLIEHYTAYRNKEKDGKEDLSKDEARDQIVKFVELEEFTELSSKPRIILCSEGFSQEITTTVLWLKEFGIDISCVEITPYQLEDDKIIIVPKIIIPLKEAGQYLIAIKRKGEQVQKNKSDSIKILINNGLIHEGDRIFLKNGLPGYVQEKFEKDNPIFSATITGKTTRTETVKWDKDQTEYAISPLTQAIFKDLHPDKQDPGTLNGTPYWVNKAGRSLWEMAKPYRKNT